MKLKYDDRMHGYWLDGKRAKSVTTLAKIPDDTYALDQWRKRQVAIGMAMSPQLIERAAAHYDDKQQLNGIAEEAMTVAKSHEASARGTAAHRIAERIDLDEMIIDTALARSVRAAWDKALASAGLEILPEYVERIVVYPEQRICGRFDRIARRRRDGKLFILDLKTGGGAVRYPHSIAVQLALYANAPLMAAPIPGGGGQTETFEKLPEKLDRRWGVIVHMPDDDSVEVHEVDIQAGWMVARDVVFPTLKWRARRDLVRPLGSATVTDPHEPAEDDRVAWIKTRLIEIGTHGDNARALVASRWPNGITAKGPWSDADITSLDVMLRSVERDVQAGFPERDPGLTDNTF